MRKKLLLVISTLIGSTLSDCCAMVNTKSVEVISRSPWSDLPDCLKRDLEEFVVPPPQFEGEGLTMADQYLLHVLHKKYQSVPELPQVLDDNSKLYSLELLSAASSGDQSVLSRFKHSEDFLKHDFGQVILVAAKNGKVPIISLFRTEIKDGAPGVLMIAALYGHTLLVQFIYISFVDAKRFESNLSSGRVTEKKVSLLDDSILLCALTLASVEGHEYIVKFLCDCLPAKVGLCLRSAYDGDMKWLEKSLLIDDAQKKYALVVAVLRKQLPVIERILATGISKDWTGLALKVATIISFMPAVEAFSASECLALSHQNNQLVDVLTGSEPYARKHELRVASEGGATEVVQTLLATGVPKSDAELALLQATVDAHEERVKLLLASGSGDDGKDQASLPALVSGHTASAQILFVAGASNRESASRAAAPAVSALPEVRLTLKTQRHDLIEKSVNAIESGDTDLVTLLESVADKTQFLVDCLHVMVIKRRFRALDQLLDYI